MKRSELKNYLEVVFSSTKFQTFTNEEKAEVLTGFIEKLNLPQSEFLGYIPGGPEYGSPIYKITWEPEQ